MTVAIETEAKLRVNGYKTCNWRKLCKNKTNNDCEILSNVVFNFSPANALQKVYHFFLLLQLTWSLRPPVPEVPRSLTLRFSTDPSSLMIETSSSLKERLRPSSFSEAVSLCSESEVFKAPLNTKFNALPKLHPFSGSQLVIISHGSVYTTFISPQVHVLLLLRITLTCYITD